MTLVRESRELEVLKVLMAVGAKEWVMAHINESWLTYEGVMARIWRCHGSHTKESWLIYDWAMAYVWMPTCDLCRSVAHSDKAPTNKICRSASSEQRPRTRSCQESECPRVTYMNMRLKWISHGSSARNRGVYGSWCKGMSRCEGMSHDWVMGKWVMTQTWMHPNANASHVRHINESQHTLVWIIFFLLKIV